jgi:alpha-beta hydrolase superfamily lysophospholipase
VSRRWLAALLVFIGVIAAAGAVVWSQLPALGAGGLLHPAHRPMTAATPPTCVDSVFEGVGVTIGGWRCRAPGDPRGTIVYLHGIADNRGGAGGIVQRFGPRGFDVIAYDSRAHGNSGGDACTYGFFEKQDLRRVIDQAARGPIALIGTSLGAAVALQEAADDRRVRALVAAESFSDLRTVAIERAPRFFTRGVIDRAFALAEQQGHFQIDTVNPALSASRITAAVLLLHGDADRETPPDHSRRIFVALPGPKRLIVVPGAGHNGSLRSEVWPEIEGWIENALKP